MSNIENKSVASIKDDLRAEHKNHVDGKYYYEEMLATSDFIANKIKDNLQEVAGILANFADEKQKDVYNKRWESLHDELQNATSNLKSRDYLGKHEQIINDLAHKIDNAENDIIRIIEQVQSQKEEKEGLSRINNNITYFQENNDTGLITFTSSVNKPTIHKVLGNMIASGKAWKIDYSECANQILKDKMIEAIGGNTCYLIKGIDAQKNDTFVLQKMVDGKMMTLDQRALIREGVKLTPPSTTFKEARISNDSEVTSQSDYNSLKSMLQKSHGSLYEKVNKLSAGSDNFFKFVEDKLDKHVKDARVHGRELHTTPITKATFNYGGNFEIHLINANAEQNVIVYYDNELNGDNNQKALHSLMDSNEDEMVAYLTERIQTKRQETSGLAKREIIQDSITDGSMEEENIKKIGYGLGLLSKLANNLRSSKGDSWTNADQKLVGLSKIIADYQYTLEQNKNIDIDTCKKQLSNKLRDYYTTTTTTKTIKDAVDKIFGDSKEQAISAIRSLGVATTMGDNSSTAFLRDEIAQGPDITFNKGEYTAYFNAIKINFELTGDDNKDTTIKSNIDALYLAINSGTDGILGVLRSKGILPSDTKNAGDIAKACEDLKVMLEQKQQAINTMSSLDESKAKIMLTAHLNTLKQKSNLTDDELMMMQSHEIILGNNDLLQQWITATNATQTEVIKYSDIGSMLGSGLLKRYGTQGGGFKGTNADILNDSLGTSGKWRDFSDESVDMIRNGAAMVMEEVAFFTLSAALVASGVGAGAGAALLASRITRWANKGLKLAKLADKLKKSERIIKIGNGLKKAMNTAKNTKIINNPITRTGAKIAKGLITPNAVNLGLTKYLTQTAYHGELDAHFTTQCVGLLKNIGMYGILGKVGQMGMPGGSIYRLFNGTGGSASTLSNLGTKATTIMAEELGMTVSDMSINWSFGQEPLTMQDILKNFALSFASEGLGGISVAGKKIKDIVMGKDGWIADGNKINPIEVLSKVQGAGSTNKPKTPGKYESGAKLEDLKKERDRLNQQASKEQDPKKKEIYNNVIKKIEERINSQDFDISESSKNIKEQIQRENKQGKYAGELSTAMLIVSKLPEEGLSNAIKKLKSPDGFWKDDVIAIQKELGLTGKDVDGIFGPKTLKKLKEYLNDYGKNKITASDLVLTKQILHEEAIQKGIGDQKSFFAEAKANKGKLTIDGVEYSVKQGKDRVEIATTSIGGGKKPLSDGEKNNLFERYKQQKIEQFVNNHPDVKNAKIIDESVVDQNQIEPKAKTEDSISEKLLTEITVEGVTIPEAVATYFKNNPIAESVAKKLTPEDIGIIEKYLTDTMYMGGAYDKNTQMILKTREQIVEGYIRDIVVKRVDTPVHAVEVKKEIVQIEEIVSNTPQTEQQATGLIYQLGEWLGKNTVGPTLDTIKNIIKWLTDIAIKFPSLKDTITIISKKVESIRIKRSVENINALSGKSTQEKIDFVEKFDMNKASNQELIALYKMTGGQGDPKDRAVVILPDGTNTLQVKLKLDIAENMSTMRSEIKKQNQRVEHNFTNSPELKLSNQEVVLDIKIGEQFNLSLGRTEYQLFKNPQGVINFVIPGNPPRNIPLAAGKEYTIGRDHTELTGEIEDRTMSRNQVSIKVDEKGNVAVKDLKSDSQTVLRKEIGKEEIINHNHNYSYNRNKIKLEPIEVKRKSEIIAIGDLHGNFEAYKQNLIETGIVDNKLNRIGGNNNVIFHGDILADRTANGFQILEHISQLKKQAAKEGGDISVIAGNHDDFLISFLTGRNGIHGNGIALSIPNGQGNGLWELESFGEVIGGGRKKILKNMKNDDTGKIILEEICNMKLVEQIDDTLFIHTNPTDNILQSIITHSDLKDGKQDIGSGIDKINTLWQNGLKQELLGEKKGINIKDFNKIADIFLATSNRTPSTNNTYYQILKNNGINHIMHGHNGGAGYQGSLEGVHVIDNDHSFGKSGKYDGNKSYAIVDKVGQVTTGADAIISH